MKLSRYFLICIPPCHPSCSSGPFSFSFCNPEAFFFFQICSDEGARLQKSSCEIANPMVVPVWNHCIKH